MTQTSAFHFESLVWDWPIAIYLFLIGISAGLVTLAVLLRRFYPQAGGADSTLLRTTLIVGPGAVILGLLILVFHLTRPWTFWKLMFHYSFTSVMSMGVMLFQLYMVVLVLWLAKIFEHDLLALQQRWLPAGSCKGSEPADARSSRTGNIDAGVGGVVGGLYRLSAVGAEIVSVPQ